MNDLRTALERVADSSEPLPVADDLWQRGRAARRRAQLTAVAAVLVLLASVTGAVWLLGDGDREARTASPGVPGGAIPSRIDDVPVDFPLSDDLAIGRASVAFLSPTTGRPVVIGARDGHPHQLDLPDSPGEADRLVLSPDGASVAWAVLGRVHVLDLETGLDSFIPPNDERADVRTLAWTPSSGHLLWTGTGRGGRETSGLLPVDAEQEILDPSAVRGIPSPTGQLTAVASTEARGAAPFVERGGRSLDRALPTDLYPQGATVRPLGWTEDHLVVAQVDGPSGSYVEGQHLVLLTSPDVPESAWTYRILARDIPQDRTPLSLAVDLVPDLDGTSSQELTHDFGDVSGADGPLRPYGIELSLFIGLGVAAAVAVLLALRWLWRRVRTPAGWR